MSAVAYDRLVAALERHGSTVRVNGSSAMANCPAHEDRNPSLSVRPIDTQALLHCFAGCQVDDVLGALGLARRDLFDEPRGSDLARYAYTDRAGRPTRTVHRGYDDKDRKNVFRQTGATGASPELYRLPEVLAAVSAGVTTYVVEGEKDVHALEALGAVATTSPMGASSWHKVDASPLTGAHVIVIPDRDGPGERYLRAVLASLRGVAASVRVARAAVGKDAADHVAAGYGLDELVPAEEEIQPVDDDDDLEQHRRLAVTKASDIVLSRVRYTWEGRIPQGAVTLVPGEEGIGKTTIGIRLAADLTRGTLPGEHYGHPRAVIIIAPEDHRAAVVVPRLEQAGADLDLVHFIDGVVGYDDELAPVVIPRDLDLLDRVVADHGAVLVWIDSLVTTFADGMKSISYKDTASVLRRLGDFAERAAVAVAAPWHLNKTAGGDTALRMMDSRAFRTAVRSVLLVVADPENGGGLIALDKANGGTLDVPALRYTIRSARYTVEEVDDQTGEIVEVPGSCGVAEWTGEVTGDGREVARALLAPRMERDDDPKAWLRRYLTDCGESERNKVLAAGEDAGHSADKLKRAARALRVAYRTTPTVPPRTSWRLPEATLDGEDEPESPQAAQIPYTPPLAPLAPLGESEHASLTLFPQVSAKERKRCKRSSVGEVAPLGDVSAPLGARPLHPSQPVAEQLDIPEPRSPATDTAPTVCTGCSGPVPYPRSVAADQCVDCYQAGPTPSEPVVESCTRCGQHILLLRPGRDTCERCRLELDDAAARP